LDYGVHVLCLFLLLLHFETATALLQMVHGLGVSISFLSSSFSFSYDIILLWLPRRILPPSTPFTLGLTAIPPPEVLDILFLFSSSYYHHLTRWMGGPTVNGGHPGFLLFLFSPRVLEYDKEPTFMQQFNQSPQLRAL